MQIREDIFKKTFSAIDKALKSNLSESSLRLLLAVITIYLAEKKTQYTFSNWVKFYELLQATDEDEIETIISDNIKNLEQRFYCLDSVSEYIETYTRKNMLPSFSSTDIVNSLGNSICNDFYDYEFEIQESLPKIIDHFASYDKINLGHICSPSSVGQLLAKITDPKIGNSIYDPACGSGSFLIALKKHLCRNDELHYDDRIRLTGADINKNALAIAKLNLFIQGCQDAKVTHCNSLTDITFRPLFDIVVSNPPFSMKLNQSELDHLHQRFHIPGRSSKINSDYFFILHTLDSLKDSGKAAIIVPTGVLFRGGQEKSIREDIIKQGVIESIISLPHGLFPHTNIQTHILVLDKSSIKHNIIMIDYAKSRKTDNKQNNIDANAIDDIHRIFKERSQIKGISRLVTIEEIKNNNFDLQPNSYTRASPSEVDEKYNVKNLSELQKEQENLFEDLDSLREKMKYILKALEI